MITQAELKELLHYDKDTGVFTWLVAKRKGSKVGDIAGCISQKMKCKQYIQIGVNGKYYLAHRLAWLYVYGSFPKNEIDHKDGQGMNNKFSNLREVTHLENGKNQRLMAHNKSGVTGVHWCNTYCVWRAAIEVNRKKISLGSYATIQEAAAARKSAEIKYGFHKNHGTARPL